MKYGDFSKAHCLLAGDVIKDLITDNLILVGDINTLNGICDDCREFFDSDEVEYLGNIFENLKLFNEMRAKHLRNHETRKD